MKNEPSLFPAVDGEPSAGGDRSRRWGDQGLEVQDAGAPLAARVRPRSLEGFVGQDAVVGSGSALRELIRKDRVPSLILWGPPGSGKTTLASVLAHSTDSAFVPFSAVTEGIPRVRRIIAEATERKAAAGRDTILFVDEIHRFNKAQQDALLPHVERGTVTLIGATTENPSFEVVGPLLSRTRVFVLEALTPESIATICSRALEDGERGLGGRGLEITPNALAVLSEQADGDARRALNALETASELAVDGRIDTACVREALQKRYSRYDKSGEEHYNLISALHKAVRGSDPDGTLYWLARMLEGGEDPLYLCRRLVRMAVEDIGLADPAALGVCVAARDAYHFLGSPEGELAVAEAALYLATAPKSNRVYSAFGAARQAAAQTPAEPVPLHLRNAPTRLMKDLGYGKSYRYDHSYEDAVAPQTYLPDSLSGERFYDPSGHGKEKWIRERLAVVNQARGRRTDSSTETDPATESDTPGQAAGADANGEQVGG
jgi:putative ATPase